MRTVVIGLRWVAIPTAVFFVFALVTGVAREVATVALVVVVLAVVAATVVDLVVRRR